MGERQRAVSETEGSPSSDQRDITSTMRLLLAPRRRRQVLRTLDERPAATERHVLARALAAEESGLNVPGEAAVRRIEIDLHHNHLPALDKAGVVWYDPDQATAQLGDNTRVQPLLAEIER